MEGTWREPFTSGAKSQRRFGNPRIFGSLPGKFSSEHHFHEEDEEFIYILSGAAISHIGDEQFEAGAGDFMAFPKNSPPHHMHNTSTEDLVYLVGGTRAPIDICNYPRKNLRQYRVHGRREFMKEDQLTRLDPRE